MNIVAAYQRLTEERDFWLDRAETVARVTRPDICVRADGCGRTRSAMAAYEAAQGRTTLAQDFEPFSHDGSLAVSMLSASIMAINWPEAAPWLSIGLHPEAQRAVMAQFAANGVEASEAVLAIGEVRRSAVDSVMDWLGRANARSIMGAAVSRSLIEGPVLVNCVAGDEPEVRIYPLRSFVMRRAGSRLAFAILEREKDDDVFADEVVNAEKPTEKARNRLYTCIDWKSGKVHEQLGDQRSANVIDSAAATWFVLENEIEVVNNYSPGHVYRFKGLLQHINDLTMGMGEAAAIASWNVLGNRGGIMSAHELVKLRSGQGFEGDPDDYGWLTAGAKIADWAFVDSYLEKLRAMLRKLTTSVEGAWQRRREVTATEVAENVKEVERYAESLAVATGMAQWRMAKAVMAVLGMDRLLIGGRPILSPTITSGVAALQKEIEREQNIRTLATVKGISPETIFDARLLLEVARRGGSSSIPEGIIVPQPPPQAAGGMGMQPHGAIAA